MPAAIEIVETMFGGNFAKELQSIPPSNDTVSRRIDNVEQQLCVTSELLDMRSPGSAVALAQTFRPALQCYNIQ
ncbi:hypothetical protein TNCV_3864701 [Trichonephila clavipes]|nr:hypothetical protein TNCV_3864701 [Trichonephila clavipes]